MNRESILWAIWGIAIAAIVLLSFIMIFCSGCNGGLTTFGAGAATGAATGHALTKTIEGAKADLERREQQLVDAYNKGVEIGAEQETLDEIQKEIELLRIAKKGVETGEGILTIDWNSPEDIGTKLGGLAAIVFAYLNRKKLVTTTKKLTAHKSAEEKYRAAVSPEAAAKLYNMVGEERAKLL